MERVLIIGVITLPLVLFLVVFADDIMTRTNTNAGTAASEADALMELVTE